MIFSSKWVANTLTGALTYAAVALAARLGFHDSATVAAAVAGPVAILAGAAAGWAMKEEAVFAPDIESLYERVEDLEVAGTKSWAGPALESPRVAVTSVAAGPDGPAVGHAWQQERADTAPVDQVEPRLTAQDRDAKQILDLQAQIAAIKAKT